MSRKNVRCHGDDTRFDIVAEFIYNRYGDTLRYVADVAGGQGLLARLLNKRYNYEATVVDPRGHTLKGVPAEAREYSPDMADYFDLIIGLHPDEATRAVAESALKRPVFLVPCCNFWDTTTKLGARPLVNAICAYFAGNSVAFELAELPFKGPKNIAIITSPPDKTHK